MERRTFIGASAATLMTTTSAFPAESKPANRDLYELCTYTLKPSKQPLLDEYLSKGYLPALARLKIGPVGVFTEEPVKEQLRVIVLTVHKSLESIIKMPELLAADDTYLKSAEPYLAAKAADSIYLRIESSLLRSFVGMPDLAKPDTSKPRLLNLRIYESHNERSAAKKVEMFEKAELAIFRRTGLTPVFFASTVVGAAMPNLTYMLVFPDEAGRKAAWDTFKVDAEWLKLRAMPEYADKEIVSNITNRILIPTAYSQI